MAKCFENYRMPYFAFSIQGNGTYLSEQHVLDSPGMRSKTNLLGWPDGEDYEVKYARYE